MAIMETVSAFLLLFLPNNLFDICIYTTIPGSDLASYCYADRINYLTFHVWVMQYCILVVQTGKFMDTEKFKMMRVFKN